jgi:hypothetical protein
MSQSASKRRICSYDMLEVRPDGYTLTETEGEMYFCNARCLCIWAVQLATRPNLTDNRKLAGRSVDATDRRTTNVCGHRGACKMVLRRLQRILGLVLREYVINGTRDLQALPERRGPSG